MSIPVSVILPYYNGSRFIHETLATVFNQTVKPLEIIIINDGSTPIEAAALELYKDRVRILNQENAGVSTARNSGIAFARGTWLAFLDQDDHWLPDKLARQWQYIQNNPECQAVHTAVKAFKRNGREVIYHKQKVELNDFLFSNPNPAYLSSVMIRKQAIISAGLFNPVIDKSQDFECFLRCARYFPFEYVDEPLTVRHEHDANLSDNFIEVWKDNIQIVRMYREEYRDRRVYRRRLLHLHIQFALRALQARDWKGFFQILGETRVENLSQISFLTQLIRYRQTGPAVFSPS